MIEVRAWQFHPPQGSLPQIIYALGLALLPFIATIGHDYARPFAQRDRAVCRFNRILQQVLALVARMHPNKIGQAAFTRLRPNPPKPQNPPTTPATPPATPEPTTPRPKTPRNRVSIRLLSARQVATRLATLLRELETTAQETGYPLPQNIRDLCTQAITTAGCQALPPRTYKPKRGLFADLITLPPGTPSSYNPTPQPPPTTPHWTPPGPVPPKHAHPLPPLPPAGEGRGEGPPHSSRPMHECKGSNPRHTEITEKDPPASHSASVSTKRTPLLLFLYASVPLCLCASVFSVFSVLSLP